MLFQYFWFSASLQSLTRQVICRATVDCASILFKQHVYIIWLTGNKYDCKEGLDVVVGNIRYCDAYGCGRSTRAVS